MNIEFQLSVERNQLVVGESTPVRLVLRSLGASATVPDPDRSDDWPKIYLRNTNSSERISFGPHDLEKRRSHQLVVPAPPTFVALAPGQEFRKSADLLNWIELGRPGRYELQAEMKLSEGEILSNTVALTVEPLNLKAVDFVGPHSGSSSLRYALWTHSAADSKVVLLTLANFDDEGHVAIGQSVRVAESRQVSRPVLSASANGLPYPAHWLVWVENRELFSLYVKQGKVEVPLHAESLHMGSVRVIEPVLLDLTGNDGSRPGRGTVVLSEANTQTPRLLLKTLESDGRLKDGPQLPLPAGELLWGRSMMLSNNSGRVILAVQRGDNVDLDVISWEPRATAISRSTKAHWQGQFVAGGVTLNSADVSHGALLLARKAPNQRAQYSFQPFQIDRNGSASIKSAVPLQMNKAPEKTIVGISAQGQFAAVFRDASDLWSRVDSRGISAALSRSVLRYGEPVDLFWPYDSSPTVVLAGPENGVTYHTLQ